MMQRIEPLGGPEPLIEREFFAAFEQPGTPSPALQTVDGLVFTTSIYATWHGTVDVPNGQLGACRLSWVNSADGWRYIGGEVSNDLAGGVIRSLTERGYNGSSKQLLGGTIAIVGKKEWGGR